MKEQILQYLNEITGSKFRPIKSNLTKIEALLKEGFTQEEIILVIQVKTFQWRNNPTMAGYLRPATLFRLSNFENYLNEVERLKNNPYLYEQFRKKYSDQSNDATENLSDLYG